MSNDMLSLEASMPINTTDAQRRFYTDAIGTGVERSMIDEVCAFATSARTHERFVQYAEIRFVYEMLLMEGGFEKVLTLVDSWVNVRRLFVC